jgi:hypothetical protein
MSGYSYNITFNDACQPSLQIRYTLLLLMFHLVFLAHFEKRRKFSTVYFPDSNQVQQTFPYLHRVDIALSIFTNNQNYHHAQTPPFKATIPNQNVDAFLAEGWMTKDHPIKCVVLGQIDEIIGYKDYCIENEHVLCTQVFPLLQLPPQSMMVCPLWTAPNLTTTQVTTARCQRPSARHPVTTARSTSQLLGLPPN